MNTVVLDRQSTSCKLPHGSLAILTTDIASFCDNQSTRRLHDQLRPFGSVILIQKETLLSVRLYHTTVLYI